MQNFSGANTHSQMIDNNSKSKNGLQQLVVHYQMMFDIEENYNYYSSDEYQNAKRKFVKYSMDNRVF